MDMSARRRSCATLTSMWSLRSSEGRAGVLGGLVLAEQAYTRLDRE